VLLPLNKLAEEIQIAESEALNFVTYFGVRRRNGLYDEREFLLAHIKHLRERIFGVVGVERATSKPAKTKPPRARLITRKKRASANTPWAGVYLQR
jgi:hypothetical protein